MHEQSFPTSEESPDRRTARAIAALEYEEAKGLGYRRRKMAHSGDPYAEPERYSVDTTDAGPGQVAAGYFGAAAVLLGATALVYKPLLMGLIAAICGVIGAMAGGPAGRIARLGLMIAAAGFFFGMLIAIVFTRAIW